VSLGQSEAFMIGDLLASAPERLHEEIGADYKRHDLRGDTRGD
jgi:hypothetical protein